MVAATLRPRARGASSAFLRGCRRRGHAPLPPVARGSYSRSRRRTMLTYEALKRSARHALALIKGRRPAYGALGSEGTQINTTTDGERRPARVLLREVRPFV